MADSSQKFLARNRAPRVQIEYDVELYGAEKKVQLPFVMGVMSDLVGQSRVEQPAVADRKFLEIDVDNFDERMKALAPRAAFTVPNTLTGEGNLAVDLTFESLADFAPGAIAAKVDALRPLLEARTQLQNLMAYMDGKTGAEALIETILNDPSLLAAVSAPAADTDSAAALDSLRNLDLPQAEGDSTGDVLAGLAAQMPESDAPVDSAADVLADLSAAAPADENQPDATDDALAALAAMPVEEAAQAEDVGDILGTLHAAQPEEGAGSDDIAADALASLAAAEPEEAETDGASAVLDGLAQQQPEDAAAGDRLGDALSSLAPAEVPDAADADVSGVLDSLAVPEMEEMPLEDAAEAALDSLAQVEVVDTEEPEDLSAVLDGLELSETEDVTDSAQEVLAELAETPASDEAGADADLQDILGALDAAEPEAEDTDLDAVWGMLDSGADGADDDDTADVLEILSEAEVDEPSEADDLDGLLGALDSDSADTEDSAENDLDALLGDLDAEEDSSLEDLLGDLDSDDDAGDLDDLLADLDDETETPDAEVEEDLDALLAGLGDDDAPAEGGEDLDLDDLLGDLDAGGDGEDLEEPELAYGTLSADRPEPQKLERKRFRLAVLGDFSGRAARGQIETGDVLAARKAILLDPDTVEDVIESFATELVLPIGKDGAGIAVKLEDLDGLHPDELYENVELFAELVSLRKQLQSGATADHAAATLKSWAEKHGTRARAPKRSSAGNAVPTDRRLSAFQQLIGDTGNSLREASPVEDLLARVVGPHIRALPDPDLAAMQAAVDEALSDAMRLVLHHPEFQSLEAQWRSLDLMARSIEADDTLDVMLYDVSAEELAADLAAQEDLSSTGFVRLLTEEPLDEENGRGGYSALIGLYQFEETPPHAELLGRIARVAAHVDAPFFAAMSPEFLKTPKADRPKLVAAAWDTLQGMAEAGHLGLASPRFLLRRPYGAKTEPCYEFEFEEFTEAEGLRGMLWANPVVLVAILLARSFKQNGPSMQLGQIMTLGDMPYHYVTDKFGDQVALPCTERNIDLDKIALAQERGFMAVSAVKGRDEVRLTSFNSVKGGEILGPWTGLPAPDPSPPDPRGLPKPPTDAGDPDGEGDLDLDDLDLGGDSDEGDDLDDLDDLLSSFGDDDDADDSGDDGMDADLAALLDDL